MFDRRTFVGTLLAAIPTAACSTPPKKTEVTIFKTPACGCCGNWVNHLRSNGMNVVVHDLDDISHAAKELGVPKALSSCHSAWVEGYFVEGHVPVIDIRRLVRERPKAAGIAVPGMPIGAPGMEQGDRREPYDTVLVGRDGRTRVFARHNQQGV